ncbi:winged helix DNA-binding protein [Parasphingorhabdus cellanae]|uniref:winged helix DNA-binding protein n=1 Tax=Parasphingorhabdus cellanae TaxID=2806553 RepID=UPI001FB1101B|nr:winged helix DNA-binding protein [Parasphingorhabdus cellanae]
MDQNIQKDIWGGQILLVSDDTELRALYVHAIELLGGRCTALPISFNSDDIGEQINVATIVVQITEWDGVQREALGRVERFCEASRLPMLIRTDLNLLDMILAEVEYPHVEHLLSDSVAELFVSLEHRTERPISSLFADRDEIDLVDLKKISADVERIARALVKLSGTKPAAGERRLINSPFLEPEAQTKVADSPIGFKAGASGDLQGADSDRAPEHRPTTVLDNISADEVRGLIRARRLRDQYFDGELFADPAWDMLLDLMAAQLEGTKVAVSSLCIAASVPPTTALRWIKTMTEEGVFERKADERDGRRIFIELSEEATAGMVGLLTMIRREGLILI